MGTVGRLAVGGAGAAPRRAAAVSAVVALGVTLITGVLVGSTSIRASDLDLRVLPLGRKTQLVAGSLDDLGPGRMAIPKEYADLIGARHGDTVKLVAGERTVNVTIAATLAGSAPLDASALVDRGDLDKLGAPAAVSRVLLDASGEGEEGIEAARSAVRAELGAQSGVEVHMLSDERDELTGMLDMLTAGAIGLLGLTVLIAVVGVGTTTALSVVERTRESGLLRAVGLSKSALRATVTTESGLYGLIGSVIGLLLGMPYAWLFLKALQLGAPLVAPAVQLVAVVATLVLLTAIAGLLPARRAAKVSPVAALGTE
jgi:putative ABC transport system permease protein